MFKLGRFDVMAGTVKCYETTKNIHNLYSSDAGQRAGVTLRFLSSQIIIRVGRVICWRDMSVELIEENAILFVSIRTCGEKKPHM